MPCGTVEVKINNTGITPAPIFSSIQRNYARSGAGEIIGCGFTISLAGTICAGGDGISSLLEQQSQLANLLGCDCLLLEITCDSNPLFTSYARCIEFQASESNDNWTQSIPYTITFESDTIDDISCCVNSSLRTVSEAWNIQEDPECFAFSFNTVSDTARKFLVNHTVSATAVNQCTNTGTMNSGYLIARDWVRGRLGFDTGIFFNSDLGVECISNTQVFNHVITNDISPAEGSWSSTESWYVVQDTGQGVTLLAATEDFSVDVAHNNQSRLKTITIQGSIRGLEQSTGMYECKSILRTKMESAQAYYNSITGVFLDRAQEISGITLSVLPVSSSRSYQPKAGIINYNIVYDNCTPCLTGFPETCSLLRERISFTNASPADVYSEVSILGRPCPILGNLGIKTKGQKTLNINLVVDCALPCFTDTGFFQVPFKSAVDEIVLSCHSMLTGTYGTVFTDSDTDSWDPCDGVYQRTVQFSYTSCCTGTFGI